MRLRDFPDRIALVHQDHRGTVQAHVIADSANDGVLVGKSYAIDLQYWEPFYGKVILTQDKN